MVIPSFLLRLSSVLLCIRLPGGYPILPSEVIFCPLVYITWRLPHPSSWGYLLSSCVLDYLEVTPSFLLRLYSVLLFIRLPGGYPILPLRLYSVLLCILPGGFPIFLPEVIFCPLVYITWRLPYPSFWGYILSSCLLDYLEVTPSFLLRLYSVLELDKGRSNEFSILNKDVVVNNSVKLIVYLYIYTFVSWSIIFIQKSMCKNVEWSEMVKRIIWFVQELSFCLPYFFSDLV